MPARDPLRFTRRRGRALAIYTLAVLLLVGLTIVAQSSLDRGSHFQRATPEPATPPTTTPPTKTSTPAPTNPSLTLDVAPRVPREGPGVFDVAAGRGGRTGEGEVLRYRVEVERGLPLAANAFAGEIEVVLRDRRGWSTEGRHAFRRDETATTRIVLATPATVDRLCAPLRTRGRLSCRNRDDVVINARRWFLGARSYGSDVGGYRRYLINHEVGHRLGKKHRTCPTPDERAPVMLQQSIGLEGCRPNPWPARE